MLDTTAILIDRFLIFPRNTGRIPLVLPGDLVFFKARDRDTSRGVVSYEGACIAHAYKVSGGRVKVECALNDGHGFLSVLEAITTDDFSREHAVCPLSGIEKHPLVGGYLYTSAIVFSIGATAGVLYREVVRWWEGPLWEVPL